MKDSKKVIAKVDNTNMFSSTLRYEVYPKRKLAKVEKIVIMLHGYGSNSKDLISLAPDLEEATGESTLFISPDAPFDFEAGMIGGYQWYSLLSRDTRDMHTAYKHAEPTLSSFIEDLLNFYDIDSRKVFLLGFSQGGMVALHFGLTYEKPLGGILSFCGYILDIPEFVTNINAATPVFLAHGMLDMVVPIQAHHFTHSTLEKRRVNVQSIISPGLGHGIDFLAINSAKDFFIQNSK
jgi:phospholipase/carboxylesterase